MYINIKTTATTPNNKYTNNLIKTPKPKHQHTVNHSKHKPNKYSTHQTNPNQSPK